MQHVLSASTTFSREMIRFKGSIGNCKYRMYRKCDDCKAFQIVISILTYSLPNCTPLCLFSGHLESPLILSVFVCAVSCLCKNGDRDNRLQNLVNLLRSFPFLARKNDCFAYLCIRVIDTRLLRVHLVIRLLWHSDRVFCGSSINDVLFCFVKNIMLHC